MSFTYSQTVALSSLLLLKFEKRSEKVVNKKIYNFSIKQYFFPNKTKNLRPFCTDVPIRFHALRTLGAGVAIVSCENSENIGNWFEIG